MGEIKVLNPIPRLSSLKEAVIKTIRDAIITGHFKPGEKLIEKRLTEDLGVSRTILREAISHLSAEGIVKVVPNKGPIVRNFEETDIYNLYQIRMALLGLSARQFTQNMTEKSLL
ncbi:MAG: GntR family transcriptional regulator, partial [Proteobacteria bacterium]|nr:GntR family transcriptional regulator [Pseudomonadota bacterium]